jgi:polysaccharide chain length determinant protein (PEP-CTERM system associated)
VKEFIGQLLLQIRGAWRYRWFALATAWLAALVGWGAVLMLPDEYEAHTRVYVDTESVLKPLLNGLAVNTDVTNRVMVMSRVLLARPNLERVARDTKLGLRARTSADFSRLIASLSQQIKTEGGGADNTYSLRYTDPDAQMAQRVVQALLKVFVEDSLGVKRDDSNSAQQFLQNQIVDYEARLRDAEQKLAAFKQQNVGLMPGETGDYYTRLQASLTTLQDLRSKQRLATERRGELGKQLEGEEPTFGLFAAGEGAESSDGRLAVYQHELDQLLLQYTDQHPKVLALKETIAQLQTQEAAKRHSSKSKRLQAPRDRADAAALTLDINPVYQNLRLELSHTNVELAELHQRISDEQILLGNLKEKVNTIPETEVQLTQLNRDYEVNRTQYQALLQRLESARLSQQADASSEQGRFRVIEPPTVPLYPIGPNRPLFMTGVLLAALALGAVIALLLNQLNPVFLSRAMLAAVTGLPVLGAIHLMRPKLSVPLLKRDPVRISMAFAGLVVLYGLTVALVGHASRFVRAITGSA